MKVKDILTNDFTVRYDAATEAVLIYTQLNPPPGTVPIRLRLSMLKDMGKEEASRFLGERILLLIPETRTQVFGEPIE